MSDNKQPPDQPVEPVRVTLDLPPGLVRDYDAPAERIAELRRVAAALVDGAGADEVWNVTVVDMALKRIEAQIDSLLSTDEELRALSESFAWIARPPHVGVTRPALLTEIARRRTLSAHTRISEHAERTAMRSASGV